MMHQVNCNDGGKHSFGPSDVPDEARCAICWMTVGEIRRRKLRNSVIRHVGVDPFFERTRNRLRTKLAKVLRILDKLDKEES